MPSIKGTKVKIGDPVKVVFWDHTEGTADELAKVLVYGELWKTTRREIVVDAWRGCDEGWERDEHENDRTSFAISRADIIELLVMEPRREHK